MPLQPLACVSCTARTHHLSTHRHENAAYADVGAQALPDPGTFPEHAKNTVLVAVHDTGEDIVRIGGGADQKEYDEEEGLEIEQSRLMALCQYW